MRNWVSKIFGHHDGNEAVFLFDCLAVCLLRNQNKTSVFLFPCINVLMLEIIVRDTSIETSHNYV